MVVALKNKNKIKTQKNIYINNINLNKKHPVLYIFGAFLNVVEKSN
jgi:hypothetical protein